jgi:hypothetical protein
VNVSRKLLLRNKLTTTRICKTDTAASNPMKLEELRDQIGTIGEKVKDDELVQITLNGFSSSRHPSYLWSGEATRLQEVAGCFNWRRDETRASIKQLQGLGWWTRPSSHL